MISGGERGTARYARAIERRWTERLGRPIVLSPREWKLLADWYDRRIPLQIVLEAIDDAFDPARRRRGGGRRAPASLSYVARAVDESWRVVLDGRRSSAATDAGPPGDPARAAWRRRRDAEPGDSPLRRLLERLLGALDAGADVTDVEAALERELPDAVGRARLLEATRAAQRDLARFSRRLEPAALERARRRTLVDVLRRRLLLPALRER